MNPLSAFSFGKIIKTFIPGLIAVTSLALVIEVLHLWDQPIAAQELAAKPLWEVFRDHSYFCTHQLPGAGSVALIGSIVLPLALIMGFFLNTFHWLWFHRYFAARAAQRIRSIPGMAELEAALCAEANRLLQVVAPGVSLAVPPLQHLFLPFLDLERFNYIRESYFSWYEFQVNSAKAFLGVSLVYAAGFAALALKWHLGLWPWIVYLGVPLALCAVLVWVLWSAALANLTRYEERFLLFIAGSLVRLLVRGSD